MKRYTPIPKISKKKAKIKAKQAEIKKAVGGYGRCQCGCGKYGWRQQAHIVRQSDSIELQDDPNNMLYLLHDCHDVFDNGTLTEIKKRIPLWENILERMKSIDEDYYNRFVNLKT